MLPSIKFSPSLTGRKNNQILFVDTDVLSNISKFMWPEKFKKQFKLLLLFLILIQITSCKDYSLIGTWRRIASSTKNLDSTNNQNSIGDLTISADSTFFLNGGGKLDNANTPGWHAGGDITGKWTRPNKNHLILQPDPKENKFGLAYKIIKLNQRSLVMVFAADTNEKDANIIEYVRL